MTEEEDKCAPEEEAAYLALATALWLFATTSIHVFNPALGAALLPLSTALWVGVLVLIEWYC